MEPGPATLVVRIAGAGPTGALAALAMADAGWKVCLHDPLRRDQLVGRARAYALNHSSRRLLERLDLWSSLRPHLTPFHRLWLQDLATRRQVLFSGQDLSPSAGPAMRGGQPDAVGWILSHEPLMRLLLERLETTPAVDLRLSASSPQATDEDRKASGFNRADLSLTCYRPCPSERRRLGLPWWQRPYGQVCVTATVRLRSLKSTSADDQAWECFRPEGPLAVLPLHPDCAQVVWSCAAARAERLINLTPTAFLEALAAVLPRGVEADALLDRPLAFPVAIALAPSLSRKGTVLVGEAAHRCHPVGGQGLNLCWRDVASLHRLASRVSQGRLTPTALPGRYALSRWPDVLLTLLSTDLLVRLFSNCYPPLLPLRRLGLAAMSWFPALRHSVLAIMCLGLPCLFSRRCDLQHNASADALPGAASLSAAAAGSQRQCSGSRDASGRP